LGAENLHVRLGERDVLKGIDAMFEPGKVTAIVGANGTGKSTLLACLAGLRRPDAGRVVLDGGDLLQLKAVRRAQRIGVLPQTPELAWSIDVETLVGLGRIPHPRAGVEADRVAVDRALAVTATGPFRRRVVTTLSGGERTRVLIARALAGEPDWLLADEPLTGLDPGHQLDMCRLFRDLAGDGCGVVLTLHDLPLVLRVADRVLVLSEGRVLADGAPQTALSPAILAQAYGIETRFLDGAAGPVIELVGRA
jgi:iron complex transport system ATP-binding protein